MCNPIANADQFAAEAEVRAMWEAPDTIAARDHVAQLWRVGYGADVPKEVSPDFDQAMDGWVSNYLFKAAAADPVRPRFVRNFMPGYRWRGHDVPDARMGGDNPDNCYRLAGIAHGGRYRVSGRVLANRPAHASFTLVENWGTSVTAHSIEMPGIVIDQDGSFTITIDDSPASGRPNHLTTNPRVKFLFVRDSMMDWARETPLDLTIERIDRAAVGPRGIEDRLQDALRRMREDVPLYYWFFRLSAGNAVNSMGQPVHTASVGGLVTQATSIGRLHLADDEAAIIRFPQADAAYNSIQLSMWWYRSIDAHLLQTGLSARQAVVDPDGWMTVVVAASDPGIANWLQTGGNRDLLPLIRWQGLPVGKGAVAPGHTMRIVPNADIDRHLPKGISRLDAGQRILQLNERRAAWHRRIAG